MKVSTLASLATIFAFLSLNCVLVVANDDEGVTYVEAFSAKKYSLGSADAVKTPGNSANLTSTISRRLLASVFANELKIGAGQVYHVYFTGYSCVKLSVTSSPEDLHVMLMAENNYATFAANDYSGAFLYVEGSKCEQTYKCQKTVNGLSQSKTYYLVIINDYDGLFGGDDAKTEVSVETCSSPQSSNSPSPSSNSPSPRTSDAPSSLTWYISWMVASIMLMLAC